MMIDPNTGCTCFDETNRKCPLPGHPEMNQQVSSRNTELPIATKTVELAVEYLAKVIQEDMGTRHGQTALYWHLINVVQQHAVGKGDSLKLGPATSQMIDVMERKEKLNVKNLLVVSPSVRSDWSVTLGHILGGNWRVWSVNMPSLTGIHFDVVLICDPAISYAQACELMELRLKNKDCKILMINS